MLLLGAPLQGQSAATVPASSSLYDKLESVSAWFPARGVFLGERPMSRGEIHRVIRLLHAAIDSASHASAARRAWARRELAAIESGGERERGIARTPRLVTAISSRQDVTLTDGRAERITSNGLGTIDAVRRPFESMRQGWPVLSRSGYSGAMTGLVATRSRLALAFEPLLSISSAPADSTRADLSVHRAYIRGVYRNVALRAGADEVRWGQSPRGSMFISGNATPFPALALGTDTAITLPWLFRLAGPVRVTALLADLGRTQDPPHAKLTGWQASIEPWSRFELGVAVLSQMGGSGGPKATLLQRVVDLFPVIDAIAPQHADLQISNKLAGGNLRLRFPELSGLDFYYELQIDDFDARRLRSSLVEDAGHLLGLRLPLLVGTGQLTGRAEWHRTSLRLYEHAQFRSGVTYRGRIIGNPLGPNAKGGYASLSWEPSPWHRVDVGLCDEIRDPSQYVTTSNSARDQGFRFVRLTDDPDHHRRQASVAWEHPFRFAAFRFAVAYDRVWRTAGNARSEWLGQLALRSHQLPMF